MRENPKSLEPNIDPSLLRIDPDILRQIELFARAAGDSPSGIIRKAFEEFRDAHASLHAGEHSEETAFGVMNRAGLVGCIKGTDDSPDDLSTNPIHMQGFGRE